MVSAIKQTVTVRPGGVIEVRSLDLPVGASAEVIVLIGGGPAAPDGPTTIPKRTLASFVGAGKGLFAGADEIDAHVREVRDEWDR